MDDTGMLWKALEGLVATVVGAGVWVMKGQHADIRANMRDIAELKTEVSTNKAKMDAAIASLDEMKDDVREVKNDIKKLPGELLTLLQRVK